eukprot:COSAG01_NODE_1258_length_11012_cov_18.155136_8_plen_40_part_00
MVVTAVFGRMKLVELLVVPSKLLFKGRGLRGWRRRRRRR